MKRRFDYTEIQLCSDWPEGCPRRFCNGGSVRQPITAQKSNLLTNESPFDFTDVKIVQNAIETI